MYFKRASQRDNRVKVSDSFMRSSISNDIQQSVTIHNILSNTACTSVDTFAIVHALLDCEYGCAKPTRFVTSLALCLARKKCRNFHSIVSLRNHFEIHNINKSFSSISQSQRPVWVKLKPENNCQTTRITTKCFINFFSVHPVGVVYINIAHALFK